jgi:hypothetical protein
MTKADANSSVAEGCPDAYHRNAALRQKAWRARHPGADKRHGDRHKNRRKTAAASAIPRSIRLNRGIQLVNIAEWEIPLPKPLSEEERKSVNVKQGRPTLGPLTTPTHFECGKGKASRRGRPLSRTVVQPRESKESGRLEGCAEVKQGCDEEKKLTNQKRAKAYAAKLHEIEQWEHKQRFSLLYFGSYLT